MNEMNDSVRVSLRMLEPYQIPDDCPFLSEDQKELSLLTLEQRAEWMAEWLALAASYDEYLGCQDEEEM